MTLSERRIARVVQVRC